MIIKKVREVEAGLEEMRRGGTASLTGDGAIAVATTLRFIRQEMGAVKSQAQAQNQNQKRKGGQHQDKGGKHARRS
jgi:hypothetical protein